MMKQKKRLTKSKFPGKAEAKIRERCEGEASEKLRKE